MLRQPENPHPFEFQVIPGFNTSVSHGGVAYQVQTEDKGRGSALIVSLVYLGGTVLVSKRTSYSDLLEPNGDEKEISTRLKHQHKVICAAVMAGKLEDLKRLAESEKVREMARPRNQSPVSVHTLEKKDAPTKTDTGRIAVKVDRRIRFKAGQERLLEIRVVRGAGDEPVRGAQVSIKVVGSDFRPQIFHAGTDSHGSAYVNLKLPMFRSGRGAVVIKAHDGTREAELRRVLRPV